MFNRAGFSATAVATFFVSASYAAYIPVYGGPAYDRPNRTGYLAPSVVSTASPTVGDGIAVGTSTKYSAGSNLGERAVRWNLSGNSTELGVLGTNATGRTSSQAIGINTFGTAVGFATKYVNTVSAGDRAVRWDATNDLATELGHLGTSNSGTTASNAVALNDAGSAVGYATKYVNGVSLGDRPVRWDAGQTTAVELDVLGTRTNGTSTGQAVAINSTGTVVGYASKYVNGSGFGNRAVRWDAASTTATELGTLTPHTNGTSHSVAYAINDTGTAVGISEKYQGTTDLGARAVRWDASGTAAFELDTLGVNSIGLTFSNARSINADNVIVGDAMKYVNGVYLGTAATRWNADGRITELGNLGMSPSGQINSRAYSINDAGLAVGVAEKYLNGVAAGSQAVLWGAAGNAIELNTLIDPTSGWTLHQAISISDTNWVTGLGYFDPDGDGPQGIDYRLFMMQIPEPTSLASIVAFGLTLLRRRSHSH